MSNETIDITTTHRAVEHNSERLGDEYPFSVDSLAVGSTEARVFTPDYGRAYAASFPNATFALVQEAGHLPQLEQPAATMALIDRFAAS